MPEAIIYCDHCGRIILPSELAGGRAAVTASVSLCAACVDRLSPEERAALRPVAGAPGSRRTPPPAARPSGRATPPVVAHDPAAGWFAGLRAIVFLAGITAGALTGTAGVLIFSSRRSPVPLAQTSAGTEVVSAAQGDPAGRVELPGLEPAGAEVETAPSPESDERPRSERLDGLASGGANDLQQPGRGGPETPGSPGSEPVSAAVAPAGAEPAEPAPPGPDAERLAAQGPAGQGTPDGAAGPAAGATGGGPDVAVSETGSAAASGRGGAPAPKDMRASDGGSTVAGSSRPAAPLRVDLPPDGRGLNGHWYKLYDTEKEWKDRKSWQDARRACEALGGHLVTISSVEENDLVFEMAAEAGSSFWIGMTDERQEGTWEWVTGEAVTFAAWAPGEPNNADGCENYAISGRNRAWVDCRADGNHREPFICEWEPEAVSLAIGGGPARDATAHPDREGYLLTPGVLANLSKRCDTSKIVPRKLATVGGAVAASALFDASLKDAFRPEDGYTFAGRAGYAQAGTSAAALRKICDKLMAAERPELVRICLDAGDLARGKTPAEIGKEIGAAVERLVEGGAIPVLYTLPVRAPQDKQAAALVAAYNAAVIQLAQAAMVPCVDAFRILNGGQAETGRFFTPAGVLKPAAMDAMNTVFLRLYRVLESTVLNRKAAGGPAPAPEEKTSPATVQNAKPEPQADPASRLLSSVSHETSPERDVRAALPAEPAPNLVANGGFERLDETTKFARGWRPHKYGVSAGQHYVRLDRTNSRTGERALEIRTFEEGVEPGVFTTLKLAQGRYRVSYWACTEVGATARVRAHLAGSKLRLNTVTDSWRQFSEEVDVDKAQATASAGLSVVTAKVRVYFDDFEVCDADAARRAEGQGARSPVAEDARGPVPSVPGGPGAASPASAPGPGSASADWVDATGDLGGPDWGDSSVWMLGSVPGQDKVIASLSNRGLWLTADGGTVWRKLGSNGRRPPDKGSACRFVFDPKNPGVFWASGMYGFGIWRTTDCGSTFEKLGDLDHVDGLGVDLSDPQRRTLLVGLHEQCRSLHRSTDGGKTWRRIGDSLPEQSSFSSDPLIIDSSTYLTNTSGWAQGKTWGIYRSEDAGKSWTKVSDFGAGGPPLLASDGSIYWQVLWEMQMIRSRDRGRSWERVQGPVRGSFVHSLVELPDGKLVGLGGTRLYVSADRANTWSAFGPAAPFKPAGVVYDEKRRSFFVWRHTKGRTAKAVMRYDLPADPALAFADLRTGSLVVWDGDDFTGGRGWSSPEGRTSVSVQTQEAHGGKAALQFHVEAPEQVGGWNWHNWALDNLTDITGFESLSFWTRFSGETRPSSFKVNLNCGPGKISTESVNVTDYVPAVFDGRWHEVVIPLRDLYGKGTQFNPKTTYELRVLTTSPAGAKFDIFVDDIRFKSGPAR